MDADDREELRRHVRDEQLPGNAVIVVRGGPASPERLLDHALRTHDAFVLDGQPIWGVSVFCALDDIGTASLDGLLERFASYRLVHLPTVDQLRGAGFELLPTFGRPHFTVRLTGADDARVNELLRALGPADPNPYHWAKRPRGR